MAEVCQPMFGYLGRRILLLRFSETFPEKYGISYFIFVTSYHFSNKDILLHDIKAIKRFVITFYIKT